MGYRYILFDADDTLVDYRADAARSFHAALRAAGKDTPEAFEACFSFDYGNWDRIGLSDVHLPHIQKSFHALYREHVTAIFRHAEETVGLNGRAEEAERAFLAAFAERGTLIEGAVEAVTALKRRFGVYGATNGLSELQRPRLAHIPLDGVFVSEEIGAIKPTAAFFEWVEHALGAGPGELLMVGDSLASDIEGARRAGIDCIWFNRRGLPCPQGVREISFLTQLPDMV